MQPIISPVDTDLLLQELEGHLLRPSNKADNLIYDITAHECPNVMREIARLREISYRDGGGATGMEMDMDDMDTMAKPYHQLIVWDSTNRQIIGGYRYLLGADAEIRNGQPYITSAHLFHYSERFIRDYLPNTIEFGRAFALQFFGPLLFEVVLFVRADGERRPDQEKSETSGKNGKQTAGHFHGSGLLGGA